MTFQPKTTVIILSLCSLLLVMALATSAMAQHTSPPPNVVLVGVSPGTGQAFLWDRAAEEYVVVRLGDRFRGSLVRRLLKDRIILSRQDSLHEVRLSHCPFYRDKPLPERRGEPAAVIISQPLSRVDSSRSRVDSQPPRPLSRVDSHKAGLKVQRQHPAPAETTANQDTPPLARPAAPLPAPTTKSATLPPPIPAGEAPLPARTTKSASPPPIPTDQPSPSTRAAEPASPPLPIHDARLSLGRLRVEVSNYLQQKISYRIGQAEDAGFEIFDAAPGTLPFQIGLRNGDKITAIAGKKVNSVEAAMDVYLSLSPGRQIDISVLRSGKPLTMKVSILG